MKKIYLPLLFMFCSLAIGWTQDQCLSFDGNDDHLSLTNPFGTVSSITFQFWMYSESDDGFYRRIISNNGNKLELANRNESIYIYNGTAWHNLSIPVTANAWHHVTVVKENGDYRAYHNGKLVKTLGAPASNTLTGIFSVGANPGGSEAYKGRLNELSVWSSVRSEAQIRADMFRPLQGNETDLELYFPLTQVGSGGNIQDATANGNDATMEGNGGTNTAGPVYMSADKAFSNGLSFDGEDDRIHINTGPLNGLQNFTFEARFLSENEGGCTAGNYRRLLGTSSDRLEIVDCGGAIRFHNGSWKSTTSGDIRDGRWHHLAFTSDVDTGLRMYLDGVEIYNSATPFTWSITGSAAIGSRTGSFEAWKGKIDDVRFWEVARSAAQIQESACKSIASDEVGLKAFYTLDQIGASGPVNAINLSHDGYLVGAMGAQTQGPTYTETGNDYGYPTAIFGAAGDCFDTPTTFSSSVTNAVDAYYSWDFDGNGTEDSNLENPTFIYPSPGATEVTLTVFNNGGCSHSSILSHYIIAPPVPDFTVANVCLGEELEFIDFSIPADNATYEWDFDGDYIADATTSGDQSFTTTSAGEFWSALNLSNDCFVESSWVNYTVYNPTQPTISVSDNVLSASGGTNFNWYLDGESTLLSSDQNFTVTESGDYVVCHNDTNGCYACSAAESIVISGIKKSTHQNVLSIFPNPANEFLNIKLPEDVNPESELVVYDITGKIRIQNEAATSLNLSELPPGLYILQLTTAEKRYRTKMEILR